MPTVEELRSRYETATRERQRAIAGLQSNGKPVYAPAEEHRRRVDAESAYRRTVASVREELEAIAADASAAGLAAGPKDPLTGLIAPSLERFSRVPAFVAEDAELLPAEEIEPRIRLATFYDDRVLAALWW